MTRKKYLKKKQFLEKLDLLSKEMEKAGIIPFDGDCGSFAHALGKLTGQKRYVCVFDSIKDQDDGNPIHCALIWDCEYFDASGSISPEEILQWGRNHSKFVIFNEDCDAECIKKIFDSERSEKIQEIMFGVYFTGKSAKKEW